MLRLLCLGACAAVILSVSAVDAAPLRRGLHPIRAVRKVWRRERALRALEKVVRAKPRLEVKYEERYGKMGGRKLFTNKGPAFMFGIGTAVNVGGFIQSDQLIPYLIAGAVVDLSAFATHVIGVSRTRRRTMISLIEDGTICETDLKPFRESLGLGSRGRRLTPRPKPEPKASAPAAGAGQ